VSRGLLRPVPEPYETPGVEVAPGRGLATALAAGPEAELIGDIAGSGAPHSDKETGSTSNNGAPGLWNGGKSPAPTALWVPRFEPGSD
jgi:hypothetical protein